MICFFWFYSLCNFVDNKVTKRIKQKKTNHAAATLQGGRLVCTGACLPWLWYRYSSVITERPISEATAGIYNRRCLTRWCRRYAHCEDMDVLPPLLQQLVTMDSGWIGCQWSLQAALFIGVNYCGWIRRPPTTWSEKRQCKLFNKILPSFLRRAWNPTSPSSPRLLIMNSNFPENW